VPGRLSGKKRLAAVPVHASDHKRLVPATQKLWTPLVPKSEAALPTRPQPVRPVPASIQPGRAVSEGVVKLETRKVTEARDEYESPVVLYGDELLTVPRSQE